MNRRRYLALWIEGSNILMTGEAMLIRWRRGLVTWEYLMALKDDDKPRHRQVAPAVKVA